GPSSPARVQALKLLTERLPVDFADSPLGQGVDEGYPLRDMAPREPVANHALKVVLACPRPGGADDECGGDLSQIRVRHADDAARRDAGVREQRFLDRLRRDVLAAADDDVL